jgi:hypothetical protein
MNDPGRRTLFKQIFLRRPGEIVLPLDPQAKIPQFKACAVQVFPARENELPNPEVEVQRGRY